MAGIKYKWNFAAFEQLRRLPKTEEMLQGAVDDMLSGLPSEDYEGGVTSGRNRLRGEVHTSTYEGILDNEKNNSLLRALGGVDI